MVIDVASVVNEVAEGLDGFAVTAELGGDAGYASAVEAVEDDITLFSVVQDVGIIALWGTLVG